MKKILRFIFSYLIYLPFVKKHNGRFTVISPIILSIKNIEFGNNVFIRNNGRIEAVSIYNGKKFDPKIVFGDNVNIEQNVHITCANNIRIKKNTSLSANVTITDINHGYLDIFTPIEMQDIETSYVEIGENCKIYNNVVILPNVTIGNHCVVGANSVVMKGVYNDYSILVGSPAKLVKYYCVNQNKWIKNDK